MKIISRNHEGRRIGESHHNSKHDDSVVRLARQMNEKGIGYKTIAIRLFVPVQTIANWCQYATRYSA